MTLGRTTMYFGAATLAFGTATMTSDAATTAFGAATMTIRPSASIHTGRQRV
jgi:hypothetical protein